MSAHQNPDQRQPQSSNPGKRPSRTGPAAAGIVAVLLLTAVVFYVKPEPVKPAKVPLKQSAESSVQDEFGSHNSVKDKTVPDQHSNEFVGSRACAECHSEIARTYSEHPMAKTLAAVADLHFNEIGDSQSVEFEALGCSYRVSRHGDRMTHAEFMTNSDGRPVFDQSVEVQYVVGSGTTAKTYLIDRGGILFESPITWYAENKKWDLSPGYQNNPRQRFNRRVSDGCVQCHSGVVAFSGDGLSNRFEKQPFPEPGIGCERCHGPGGKHVEKFNALDSKTIDDSNQDMLIVNPAHLDKRQEESVCYQCHLEGKRRILRKGRSYHSFRAGMVTEEIWTVFTSPVSPDKDGNTPFTSQVQQMQSSACFKGSDGRMRCTTCHDPHQSPKPDDHAAFYRDRCLSCHSDQGCSLPIEEQAAAPAISSCIFCHMPRTGSSDILHTSQSDHRVLRTPQSNPLVAARPDAGQTWEIFDESEKLLPRREVDRARALALCDQSLEEGNPQLMAKAVEALEAVLVHDAVDVDVLRKLGFLYGNAGNIAKAKNAFEAALRLDSQDEMSLKNLGFMSLRTRSNEAGIRSYESYLKINPWDGTVFGPYAAMLAQSGKRQAAVKVAEQGLLLDPTQRDLRSLAVRLYSEIGNQEMSQQHQLILKEISTRLDPWDQKRRDRKIRQIQESQQQKP